MASTSLTILLRHTGACKVHQKKARHNEQWAPPRALRCDTMGYYSWNDIVYEQLVGTWSPEQGTQNGNRYYYCDACMLALLRQDLNKCRFVLIAQKLPGSANAGVARNGAWIPKLVRIFVGSSLPFINEVRISRKLTGADIHRFSCFSHRTKSSLLAQIFEKKGCCRDCGRTIGATGPGST